MSVSNATRRLFDSEGRATPADSAPDSVRGHGITRGTSSDAMPPGHVGASVGSAGPNFCTPGCRLAYTRRRDLERYRGESRARQRARPPKQCEVCGQLMPVLEADDGRHARQRRCCSLQCYRQTPRVKAMKRRAKAARAARKRGAADCERFDPIDVFTRDRWRCQLCGCSTPRRLRGRMVDNAPELDHIVALSAGGAHTWRNVQCLCRQCNRDKATTAKGSPRLF